MVDANGDVVLIPDPANPNNEIIQTSLEPTAEFERMLQDPVVNNVLDQYFPTLKSDLVDVQKRKVLFDNMVNQEGVLSKQLTETDALVKYFENVYDNPISGIASMIAFPDERAVSRENPIQELRQVARSVANADEEGFDLAEEAKEGFLNSIFNHALVYAGGASPNNIETGLPPFNVNKFSDYLRKPIVPGRRESVLDILRQENLIDETHFARINQVLIEMDNIQKAMSPQRAAELGEVIPAGLSNQAQEMIGQAAVRGLGAGVASNFYGFLNKAGIFGGSGSLVAAGLGANLADRVVSENPALLAQTLMTQMLKEPDLMAFALERARKEGPKPPPPIRDLRKLYSFLYSGALIPAGTEFREFARNIYGRDIPETASERQERERQEARDQRQEATPPPQVSAPQPVAPPPVAQAPMPMPQAPAPTAPASPASRQQFAAAFPFDVTSDVIRSQGIGSLGRTG